MLTKRPVTRYLPLCVGVAFLFFFFIALNSVFKSNQQTRSTLAPQIFSRKDWKKMTLEDCYQFNNNIRKATKFGLEERIGNLLLLGLIMAFRQVLFFYHSLRSVFDLVGNDVGPDPIGHDLLSYFMIQLALTKEEPIHYLEIGVSVGKCLLTQCLFLGEGSYVYAFDFEYINPTLANNSNLKQIGESHYRSKTGVNFFYELGDVTKDDGWENLAANKLKNTGKQSFNIIYSDALHNYEGVSHELVQIFKHNLLDLENFVIVWDDCQVDVKEAMMEVYKYLPLNHKPFCNGTMLLGGWLGNNEHSHNHCILTSLNLKQVAQMDDFLRTVTWSDPVMC